jgi:uncharacterized protein YyaL (SSP411 family)
LLRLAHLAGSHPHALAAERALTCFFAAMDEHPSGHGSLLMALQEWLQPTQLLILAGPRAMLPDWQAALAAQFLPTTLILAIANDIGGLPVLLQRPATDSVNAFLCQGSSCLPPIDDCDELIRVLRPPGSPRGQGADDAN